MYTEQGEVRCVCPETGPERRMTFQGFEADRDTLKCRCPAAAGGEVCAGCAHCRRRAGRTARRYGRIVRIFSRPCTAARRGARNTASAPLSSEATGRVNQDFGLERHFVRG
ncbi:MAG: hypothetical protein OXH60_12525 [Rhodospirillales bacterium]|nr:hypothetical protein [Rhodospirillales bacterium]